jgi:hypothetical protein
MSNLHGEFLSIHEINTKARLNLVFQRSAKKTEFFFFALLCGFAIFARTFFSILVAPPLPPKLQSLVRYR